MSVTNLPVVNNPDQPNQDNSESESDILDRNSDESSNETSKEDSEEDSEEESESTEETQEDEDESEVDEDEDSSETQDSEEDHPGTPQWNKLRKDPVIGKLLKEHPEIQARYFKAEKYAEFFPTVEEAETAAQKSEILDQVDELITAGNFNPLIDRVYDNDPRSLESLADTILPKLQEKNPQLFVRAVNPVLKALLNQVDAVAAQNKNENLKNAALVIRHFLWNNGQPPPDSRTEPNKVDPEKLNLQQQNQQLVANQYKNFHLQTVDETTAKLVKLIEDGLDPNNKLTPFTRKALIAKVVEDVNLQIKNNAADQKYLDSLWKNAVKQGFSEEAKLSIKRAFLGRARKLIQGIRQKHYSEAIGNQPRKQGKTTIPSSGGSPRPKSNMITPREAKAKGMSEMDIINFGTKG